MLKLQLGAESPQVKEFFFFFLSPRFIHRMAAHKYYEVDEEAGSDSQRLLVADTTQRRTPTVDSDLEEDEFYLDEKDFNSADYSFQKKVPSKKCI